MARLKALVLGAVFCAIGLGSWSLVACEWSLSFAAGSLGGATFKDSPGLAWFILAFQVAFGGWFLFIAAERVMGGPAPKDETRPDAGFQAVGALLVAGCAVVATCLGLWATYDLIVGAVGAVHGMGNDMFSMAISGFCLFASIGVFITLLISMVVRPLYERLRPYLRTFWRE